MTTKAKIRLWTAAVSFVVFAITGVIRSYAPLSEPGEKFADYVLEICAGLMMIVALSLLDIWLTKKSAEAKVHLEKCRENDAKGVPEDH